MPREQGSAAAGVLATLFVLIGLVGTLLPQLGVPVFRELGCLIRGAQYVEFFGAKGCISASDFSVDDEPAPDYQPAFVAKPDLEEAPPEAPITVPDVTGLGARVAENDLAYLGLKTERADACKTGGFFYPREVVDQDPRPGTPIFEHDFDATIWVNTARWIPDTIGRPETAAIERLERAGFVPRVQYVDHDFERPGFVTEQHEFAELGCPGRVVAILVEVSRGYEY